MNRWLLWIALLVVVVAAVRPLIMPYQVAGHSAYVDLTRAEAFHQSLRNGDITPRWLPDFYYRYGSPIFNFYAPLTYYVIEAFRLVGFDGLWSLKFAYLLFWLLAGWFMFLLASEIFKLDGAFAATAVYMVSPYLLLDVYVRVGIAEFACFAFLPMILLGIWRTGRQTGTFGPIWVILGYAMLTLTHNITALIATPLLLFFALIIASDWKTILKNWFAFLCGLALAAIFWLPAITEKSEVHAIDSLTGGFFQFENHFLFLLQLFIRKWEFGSSIPGSEDKMGFMFGELLWLGLLSGIMACLLPRIRRDGIDLRVRLGAFLASSFCLLMTLPISSFLWQHLPLINYVQFPWRFLLPATVFASLLVGGLPHMIEGRMKSLVALSLVLLALIASWQYLRVRYVFHDIDRNAFVFVEPGQITEALQQPHLVRPDHFLTIETIRLLGVTSTAGNDYLPIACTEQPTMLPKAAAEPGGADIEILSSSWGYAHLRAEVQAAVQENVIFNHFYFPGWRAKVDDVPAFIKAEEKTGRMVITVSPGRHAVEVSFKDTPIRILGKIISLFGMALLLIWIWIAYVTREENEY